jgi:fructuronate reductase
MPSEPPVRMVHLGLGNFHRAHQAWYTANASDAADWGIAAFTGRRPDTADDLRPQDGLYTLITRTADGDTLGVVGSLAAVHPAGDQAAYLGYLGRPEVAVVTITVTEAGYLRGPDGRLDVAHPVVVSDVAALRKDPAASVASLPGKLVAGLLARRAAGSDPITLLSCDNLPHNGSVTEAVVRDMADAVDDTLRAWIDDHVDFATSMVDRITPATTDDDRKLVAASQGYQDASPVPRFPGGRPAWQDAGARIVDDVTPYEQRKLWLLNGSHSLLAYAGSIRGRATVDEAIADPSCREWVESFWNEASPYLTLPADSVADYRQALVERFSNPRIGYQLSQIASDGSIKLPVRILPTLLAERAAGRLPIGCVTAVAAWVLHLRGMGAPVKDAGAGPARTAAAVDDLGAAVGGVLDTLDARLGQDRELVALIVQQCTQLVGRSSS